MSQLRDFPADSFLRVFHADRDLADAEISQVEAGLRSFLGQWSAHEMPVRGDFEIVDRRFIVVAADESKTVLSGCSKDSLVGAVRKIGAAVGCEFVHAPPICFRDGGRVEAVSRDRFGELVTAGRITGSTPVFDHTIHRVGDYVDGRFEVKAADCWHAQAWELA